MKNKTTRLTGAALPGLLCLLMSLSALWASASPLQNQVTGRVTDTNDNPIPGVNISLKNTNTGTQTDLDGNFELVASPQDTLRISYIGFKTLLLPVGNQTRFSIQLEQNITDLGEVTINAGYYNTTRREQTGSIARIDTKSIEDQPVLNPLAAMQGRMPGVNITQSTGVPGGGFTVQIRGRNSLRADANEPLYVIDGVPYASETLGYNQVSGSIIPGSGFSPLNSINPADIKSIEVLKDADATAIYGSRGANGVVLITTKTGRAGETQYSVNINSGFSSVGHTANLLNTAQYLEMRREAFANDGIDIPANAYDVNGTWDPNRFTDWQEILIGGQGHTLNAQASVTGGSIQTRFLLSGGYQRQSTVFPGDYAYGKGSVHLNLNHTSQDDRFKATISATYTSDQNNLPQSDFTRLSQQLAPNAPEIFNEAGDLNWENSTWNNPFASLVQDYIANTKTLIANGVLSYELLDGFTARMSLGYTTADVEESLTSPSTIYNPAFGLGPEISGLTLNTGNSASWILEPQLNWKESWEKHQLDVLVGGSFQAQQRSQFGQYGFGFASNALINNIAAASTVFILNNTSSQYRYAAAFARINYQYASKYLINLTGRRDGSSRFGPGRQFANFGAVGLGYIFSEEACIKEGLPFLSFGKLRGSYGVTGSDNIGDYQFLDTYATSTVSYDGSTTLIPSRLFNPDFGWETNTKLELALTLGFLKDRINTTVAWYSNRSSNQLVGIPLPGTTGFTSLQANLDATVANRGWEVELNTQNLNSKNWNWETAFNLSIPNNELLSFPGLETSTYANQYAVGQPLVIRKVYAFNQVNPETGVYEFEDVDGDGQLSSPNDRQSIISLAPKYYGGLSNRLSYKNWELDVFFQFVKQTGLDYTYQSGRPGGTANQSITILDRWQQSGDESRIQRFTSGRFNPANQAYTNLQNSNLLYADASFVRLKNVVLGYTLARPFLQTFTCRFYVQGQNLLTFTPYAGNDPENQSTSILPPLRTLTTGVNFTF